MAAPLACHVYITVRYNLLSHLEETCSYFSFCPPFWSPGKEAPAGSGGLPGGQSDQFPGSRYHHAGGAAALDVP